MKREHFIKVVEEALDSLPQEFRSRIRNVAVLVEDMPPNQPSPQSGQQRRLLLGLFHGVPTTKKSIFDLSTGPTSARINSAWRWAVEVSGIEAGVLNESTKMGPGPMWEGL